MNSVIINEGQLLLRGEDWVAKHLVHYFKTPLNEQMKISNHGVYLADDQQQKPFSLLFSFIILFVMAEGCDNNACLIC